MRVLSMRDLASLVESEHFSMIARTYIDDSWDGRRQIAVAAGGFVGTFGQWCDLKTKWNRALRDAGLTYFRSTEYYSLRNQFQRFRNPINYPKPKGSEAAALLRSKLDRIIQHSGVMGAAVCVPLVEYERIRSTEDGEKILPKDAFELALQLLMIELAQILIRECGTRHQLAFFCDSSPSSARITHVYALLKRTNARSAQVMGSLTHLDDKKYPQIQAADLMAHLARENLQRFIEDGKIKDGTVDPVGITQLTRLAGSVHIIKCVDRTFLEHLLRHELQRRAS